MEQCCWLGGKVRTIFICTWYSLNLQNSARENRVTRMLMHQTASLLNWGPGTLTTRSTHEREPSWSSFTVLGRSCTVAEWGCKY